MVQDKFIGKWHTPWDESLEAQVAREKGTNVSDFVNHIVMRLQITEDDVVLDVCCGNGLLTKQIAKHCRRICGVDFSEALIDTANKECRGENVTYYLHDALDLSNIFPNSYFDKCYCDGSLQYFDQKKGKVLLEQLSKVTKTDGTIFICNIPDKRRWSNFYDTAKKKVGFFRNRASRLLSGLDGEDRLGWWWHPDQVKKEFVTPLV